MNTQRRTARWLAPKASRIVRALLVERERPWGVLDLARAVRVSAPYVVKVFNELRGQGYLDRSEHGSRVHDPQALLDAWAHARTFGREEVEQRFVVVGDPASVESSLVEAARRTNTRYGLTLFAGARHRAPFVRYPVVHAYCDGDPLFLARELEARAVSEGGNLTLVQPGDEGVFFAAQEQDGARIVSDVQLYVDLFNFEARGREQAEFLLEKVMPDLRQKDSPEAHAALLAALKVRGEADRAQWKSEYAIAADLYQRVVDAFAVLGTRDAERDLQRARLLLWMMLAHVAFDSREVEPLERARSLFVTDTQVEEARRGSGYNPGLVALAILAYYSSLFLGAKEPAERDRYFQKAKTFFGIVSSPYTESQNDARERAESIWKQVQAQGARA